MPKIKCSKQLANNPNTPAPRFNFTEYAVNRKYHNNPQEIDFVVYNGSLYVCTEDDVYAQKGNIEEQSGFLCVVRKGDDGKRGADGKDGRPGPIPEIGAKFEGNQLVIYEKNGTRLSSSPDLTGPAWIPVLNEDETAITWTDDQTAVPSDIPLNKILPRNEYPVLFRLNSDNTRRSDENETGPGYYIQWKREGAEEWTNLMSISELMNLALAGVSFWEEVDNSEVDATGQPKKYIHFGHKQVVKATYDASKLGNNRIAEVVLGDVLFDAGRVPFPEIPDYTNLFALIQADIRNVKAKIEALRGLIPTKLSQLENDVPYIKSINGQRPNNDGNFILDDLIGEGTVKSVNYNYPDANGNVSLNIPGGTVKSVNGVGPDSTGDVQLDIVNPDLSAYVKSVNNNLPDANGNVTITLGDVIDLTDYVKKQDLITINDHLLYGGGNLNIGDGTVAGLENIEFRVNGNKLQYRIKENDTWGDYIDIMTISPSVDGEDNVGIDDIKFELNNGELRYQTSIEGVWQDWRTIPLPEGTGGGACDVCWTEEDILDLIARALAGLEIPDDYLTIADLDGYVKISDLADYATKAYVDSKVQDIIIGNDLDYYRIFTLYQRTNSPDVAPNKPVLGNWVWDTSEGEIVLQSMFTSNWENHPQNATSEAPYLWLTSATYSYKTKSEVGEWETPICLTAKNGTNGTNGTDGRDGTDGADGKGIEFIYKLVDSLEEFRRTATPVAPGEGDDSFPEGWSDHPNGISEEHPIEIASVRTSSNGQWSAYSAPFIWSMWGEDGMDGDGVEYIFCVTADPSIGAFANEIPLTDDAVTELGASYQVNEWLPNGGNGNWTDNPLDVSEQQPYEWVAIRKYDGETKKWGPFSDPKVWGLWGQKTVVQTIIQDGTTFYKPYTCYAFTRTNVDLTGYSVEYTFDDYNALEDSEKSEFYDNPLNFVKTLDANGNVVNNITWYDTVPNTQGQLWLITNHIGDEGDANETAWNGPIKWGDNAGFQIEYAISDENTDAVFDGTKVLPSLNAYKDNSLETINEAAWRQAAAAANCGAWSDDVEDPVYMATAYKKGNGDWSSWTVAKIKGEKGNPGDVGPQGPGGSNGADGAGIEFVYYRTNSETNVPGTHPTLGTYDPESSTTRTEVSEDPDRDDFFPKVTASGFNLVDGTYWHDHPQGVTEALPYEWVAIRHSSPNVTMEGDVQVKHQNWGDYNVALWSKYGANGRDGDGIEYVFWALTEQQAALVEGNVLPTRLADTEYRDGTKKITDSECRPSITLGSQTLKATDDNPGVSDEKPYVYASMRKYNGTNKAWGEFSPIKLWLVKETDDYIPITLDITDDTHQILVDEDGQIVDSDRAFRCSTNTMSLYRGLVLLSNGIVSVNNVVLAELVPSTGTGSNTMHETSNEASVTCDGITASVRASYAWKYENSNTSTISLIVTFPSGTVLNKAFVIPITVTDNSNTFVGVDTLKIVPVLKKGFSLLSVPNVQKTSGRGTHDYSSSSLWFYSSPAYGTLEQIMPVEYWFGYDKKDPVSFSLSSSQMNELRALDDGTQSRSVSFYYDRNGNSISSNEGAFFCIRINNSDYNDNSDPWRRWTSSGYAILSAFASEANEETENYPIDEMYFAVGEDGVVNDEATVYIVYPGKDGEPGQPGQPGEPGKGVQTVVEYYLASPNNSGVTTSTSGWTVAIQTVTSTNKYLWNYERVTYSDGSHHDTTPVIIGVYGDNGVGIASIVEHYLATSAASGVTRSTSGWTTTVQTITSTNKYLWNYETITYTDNSVVETTPVIIGAYGDKGEPGTTTVEHVYQYLDYPVMRVSNWSDSQLNYYDGRTRVDENNEEVNNDEGTYFLDVVEYNYTNDDNESATAYYKCISDVSYSSSSKGSTDPSRDSTHWEMFSIADNGAFKDLLVTNSAFIQSLSSNQVVILDDNDDVVAGMTGNSAYVGNSDVRIWAGKPTSGSDITTTPFNVTDDGTLTASKATITGTINADNGTINGTLNFGQSGLLVAQAGTMVGTFNGSTLSIHDQQSVSSGHSVSEIDIDYDEGITSTYKYVGNSGLRTSTAKLDSGILTVTNTFDARSQYEDIYGSTQQSGGSQYVSITSGGIERVTPRAAMRAVFSNQQVYIHLISQSDYDSLSAKQDNVLYVITD